jgi:hypothetical protein
VSFSARSFSVCLLHFGIFLKYHWANFSQICHKSALTMGKGIQISSNEEKHPSARGDNSKRVKIHWNFFKIFSRTKRLNLIKLGTNYPWVKEIQGFSNKGPRPLQRGDDHKNGMGSFKNLIENHWVRKAEIYKKAFWRSTKVSLLKSSPRGSGATKNAETFYTCLYMKKYF